MRIPRTIYYPELRRLNFSEQRLVDLWDKNFCETLPLGPDLCEADDLVISTYKPLISENGNWTFGNDYVPIFSLQNSENRLNSMEEVSPSQLVNFRMRMRRSLYGCHFIKRSTQQKVYSPVPIDWKSDFKMLKIKGIFTESFSPYLETAEMNSETVNYNRRVVDYRKKLKAEIKFGVFISNTLISEEILGYGKSPFLSPTNRNMSAEVLSEFGDKWKTDFGWITQNELDLQTWSTNFNRDLLNEFQTFINWEKQSIEKYKNDMQLENSFLWLEILDSPKRYTKNLKFYSQLLNGLLSQTIGTCETLLKYYAALEGDFMKLITKIIDR